MESKNPMGTVAMTSTPKKPDATTSATETTANASASVNVSQKKIPTKDSITATVSGRSVNSTASMSTTGNLHSFCCILHSVWPCFS